MRLFSYLMLFLFSSFSTTALELEISGKHTTRVRKETSKTRAQQRVILKFAVNINDSAKFVLVGANGTAYSSSYDTFYDSSNDDEFDGGENVLKNLSVKNFYFEKIFKPALILQAGAIPTTKGLTNVTALESTGWVDGLRIENKTSLADIRVTVGSLTQPEQTNAFQRQHDLNYFEVSLKKEIFDNVLFEIGYENHDSADFLTLAHSQKVAITSDKIISLLSEALINLDEGAVKASVGVKGDFIRLLTNKTSGITFDLRSNYNDKDDIGQRGTTYNSGFKTSDGHYGSIEAKFNIKKIAGYCRYRQNYDSDIDDKRFECGGTIKH